MHLLSFVHVGALGLLTGFACTANASLVTTSADTPHLELYQTYSIAPNFHFSNPAWNPYLDNMRSSAASGFSSSIGNANDPSYFALALQITIAQYEGYYASVFYAFFASLGLDVRAEESSNAGRLDMAVFMQNRCWIFEFKVVEDAAENKALPQILEKGYDAVHRAAWLDVYCIGIEFSRATRTIVSWEQA
jgi:hypothetical protein